MREIGKLSIILLIFTIVAGGLLGVTNNVTKGVIQEKALAANIIFMKELISDADDFKVVENPGIASVDDVEEVYEALKGGSTIGYVVKTIASGYGGDVVLLTAINTDGTIGGMKVASQSETPGLGARIAENDFSDQFKGKSTAQELKVTKSGESGDEFIQTVSGATVSSKAATAGVNAAIKVYEEVLK